MRILLALSALLIALASLAIDTRTHAPESSLCLYGGCRADQLATGIGQDAGQSATALLLEDPASPALWCAYGEFLATTGNTAKAVAAFDRALELGSGMAFVSMRVANFDFANGRTAEALRLVPTILKQSEDFDPVIFSYLERFSVPTSALLGSVIPPDPRPAQSWLEWVRRNRSAEDLQATWTWMRQNHLGDEDSAIGVVRSLWDHKLYAASKAAWTEWLGAHSDDEAGRQLLANPSFQAEPRPIPFDWRLNPNPGVAYNHGDGLEVTFLGTENVEGPLVEQVTPVTSGRYRLAIEQSADGITTDQGPLFELADVDDLKRLSTGTPPLLGSIQRRWYTTDFQVSSATKALRLQLTRRWSLKIDSKIKGTLHVYHVSLVALSRD